MTEHTKTQHTLPPEVTTAFATLGDDMENRNIYVAALRAAGWTLQSISVASELTRERVRQIVKEEEGQDTLSFPLPEELPLPLPPVKAEKVRKPRAFVEPDPVKLARLLVLQPLAQKVRSNSDNYRAEAEEYTKLLAEVHLTDGVPIYRLAKRLGISHGAVRFRLVRYGYITPKDGGSSKVYTPILMENRVV